jgi:hypothetical protein
MLLSRALDLRHEGERATRDPKPAEEMLCPFIVGQCRHRCLSRRSRSHRL